jgi:predicted lipid-binding transport protein (Tim44 family)
MSQPERRVLAGMIGALIGMVAVGALIVMAGAGGAGLDSVFGPLLAALAALLIIKLMPSRQPARVRTQRPDDD